VPAASPTRPDTPELFAMMQREKPPVWYAARCRVSVPGFNHACQYERYQ